MISESSLFVHRLILGMLGVFIALLPLVWIHATRFGGFDVRLPYLFAVVLGLAIFAFPKKFFAASRYIWHGFLPWILPYFLYLIVLSMALAGAPDDRMVVRQIFFLSCGLIFAIGIYLVRAHWCAFRFGGTAAILLFIAAIEVQARQIDLSWTIAIERFLTMGDLDFLFYEFWRAVFQTAAAPGVEVPASDKNLVSATVFMALVFLRIGHPTNTADRAGQVLTIVAAGLLIMLNTRSVMVALILCLPLALLIGVARSGNSNLRPILLGMFAATFVAATLLLLSSEKNPVIASVQDRFSFGDASSENRFTQVSWAMSQIETAPLGGSGLVKFEGMQIHNLFFGAWVHAGLLAFCLVLAFYVVMLLTWLLFIAHCLRHPAYWVLPLRVEWVIVLPVMPFLLPWLVGDAGHPSFASWTALCGFFSIILVNQAARRRGERAESDLDT